jgi:iron complex outermembrane receptor protein
MTFQKTNPALITLGALLISTSGVSLHAAESSSATTNAASTNASTTNGVTSTNSSLAILSPIMVIAQDSTNGVVEGTDFRNPGGFGPIDSKAATRTYTPNMENPVSVQVISQEVLKSQQTIYLVSAIQNVAGVVPQYSGNVGDSFSIRGFNMQFQTYQDGLKYDGYAVGYQKSMQNIQNIEVVKGPASVLYGQAEPGGLVNMNTKKPLTSNYFAVDQQIGSWSFYRTTVDATGPIDQEKKFLYRFNLDQQNNYSYRDFMHNQRLFLFPTFRWQPTDKTQVTLELTYANVQQQYDNGVPFLTNGTPAPVGRGANFVGPWLNEYPNQQFTVQLSSTHKFNDDWMLHGAMREDFLSGPAPLTRIYAGEADQNGNMDIYAGGAPFFQQWTQEFLADLTGKFKTWFLNHTALLGCDFYHQGYQYQSESGSIYTQNIYRPNWNIAVPQNPFLGSGFQTINDAALFAQDQVELPGHLFGLAGFRYDGLSYGNTAQGPSVYNNAVTPRYGVLWRPVKPVSFYGSYTANFGASAGGFLTANGAALPPQSAQQWELGMKAESPNKKLSGTLSFYQLTKQNVPQADPSNALFYQAIGQVQSRGMELQLAGEILPGWKVIAGYSYINAFITQQTPATSTITDNGDGTTITDNTASQVGQRLTGVPYNSGSLWTTYEIQSGPFKRLLFGAGVVGRSQEVTYVSTYSTTTDANGNVVNNNGYSQEQIPAFAVVNLMAAYPFNTGKVKWTAQVNLDNLFNTSYYSTINPYQAMPGAPVSFMASLKAEF